MSVREKGRSSSKWGKFGMMKRLKEVGKEGKEEKEEGKEREEEEERGNKRKEEKEREKVYQLQPLEQPLALQPLPPPPTPLLETLPPAQAFPLFLPPTPLPPPTQAFPLFLPPTPLPPPPPTPPGFEFPPDNLAPQIIATSVKTSDVNFSGDGKEESIEILIEGGGRGNIVVLV